MFSPAASKATGTALRKISTHRKVRDCGNRRCRFAPVGHLLIGLLCIFPVPTYLRNLGEQPATGHPVQVQTATQPCCKSGGLAMTFSCDRLGDDHADSTFSRYAKATGNHRRAPTRPA